MVVEEVVVVVEEVVEEVVVVEVVVVVVEVVVVVVEEEEEEEVEEEVVVVPYHSASQRSIPRYIQYFCLGTIEHAQYKLYFQSRKEENYVLVDVSQPIIISSLTTNKLDKV